MYENSNEESSVHKSWMFNREAEDHYIGSIVMINNIRGSAIGSIHSKLKKEQYSTFVGRLSSNEEIINDEGVRATTVVQRNP